jgi:hypothetical protein
MTPKEDPIEKGQVWQNRDKRAAAPFLRVLNIGRVTVSVRNIITGVERSITFESLRERYRLLPESEWPEAARSEAPAKTTEMTSTVEDDPPEAGEAEDEQDDDTEAGDDQGARTNVTEDEEMRAEAPIRVRPKKELHVVCPCNDVHIITDAMTWEQLEEEVSRFKRRHAGCLGKNLLPFNGSIPARDSADHQEQPA